MIKNYNQYIKESLLDKLEGPSEEEVWNNLKDFSPNKILYKSIQIEYYKGIKYALDNGSTFDGLTSPTTRNKLLRVLYNNGDKELVYKLLNEFFYNKNDKSNYYLFSCIYGYLKGVQNVITEIKKYNFNKTNNFSGLELAVKNNNLDIVIYLIEQFEYTQEAYDWESNAKKFAYKYNNRDVLDYFLYRGY